MVKAGMAGTMIRRNKGYVSYVERGTLVFPSSDLLSKSVVDAHKPSRKGRAEVALPLFLLSDAFFIFW
jgi:hypothetical protein